MPVLPNLLALREREPAWDRTRLTLALARHIDLLTDLDDHDVVAAPHGQVPARIWQAAAVYALEDVAHPDGCMDEHLLTTFARSVPIVLNDKYAAPAAESEADELEFHLAAAILLRALLRAGMGHLEELVEVLATDAMELDDICSDCLAGQWALAGEHIDTAPHHEI